MTADIPIQELRLPMPWGHVAAKAWGSPSNRGVLVVHGIMDNAGSFDRLVPLLPRNYYYVCIDLPGHGMSSHFPTGIPLDHFYYVIVIKRVLDFLKWERYSYLGHSFGAILGLVHSSLYPERVEKLMCLDLDSPIPVTDDELLLSLRYNQDYTIQTETDENIVKLYSKEEAIQALVGYRLSRLNLQAAKAMLKRSLVEVGKNKYRFNHDRRLNVGVFALFNASQHQAIHKQIKSPVLIISSSELSFVSDDGSHSARFYTDNKDNRFVTVEGDHDVHMNNPERVAPHICQYLGSFKSSL